MALPIGGPGQNFQMGQRIGGAGYGAINNMAQDVKQMADSHVQTRNRINEIAFKYQQEAPQRDLQNRKTEAEIGGLEALTGNRQKRMPEADSFRIKYYQSVLDDLDSTPEEKQKARTAIETLLDLREKEPGIKTFNDPIELPPVDPNKQVHPLDQIYRGGNPFQPQQQLQPAPSISGPTQGAPSATGPQGQKIFFVNGQWVDANGQAIR